MAKKLLLSYDASLDWHYDKDEDFRKTLVEFLFLQGATEIDSCVSSTLFVTLPDDGILLANLNRNLLVEFGNHFKFVLVLIAKNNNGGFIIQENPSNTIRMNFEGLINRIRNAD